MILLSYTLLVMFGILCIAVIAAGIYLNFPVTLGEIPLKTRGAFPYDSRNPPSTHIPVSRQEDRAIPTLTDEVTFINDSAWVAGYGVNKKTY